MGKSIQFSNFCTGKNVGGIKKNDTTREINSQGSGTHHYLVEVFVGENCNDWQKSGNSGGTKKKNQQPLKNSRG